MYGMLKHVLLSSLCKNNYLGVGIPVYTCLSKRACHFTHKFVSLPFLTHTTYIRFFFWPAIQAAQKPAIQQAFQSESAKEKKKRGERREKGKEGKERRGKYDAPVNFITAASSYIYRCPCKRREFPSMPVCQRGLVTSHIPSFLFLASHSQRPAIQQAVQSESRGFASQHSCHFIHANAGNSRLCLLAKESL
jgi:hypothetical protein